MQIRAMSYVGMRSATSTSQVETKIQLLSGAWNVLNTVVSVLRFIMQKQKEPKLLLVPKPSPCRPGVRNSAVSMYYFNSKREEIGLANDANLDKKLLYTLSILIY